MTGAASRPYKQILHVDMDAFFASVEQRDDPRIRGKPVLVGFAKDRRGVVLAASYEARPFGLRSAMSMADALRRCPHVTVVPPRHDRYMEVSAQVFAIFRRFTPLVEGLSVDEAFLDVTESRALFGDGETIARRIKAAIWVELGLTASAGVAPIKFAAKIASDLEKPNGLVVVPEDVAGFLAPLAIERMWGLGPKSAPRLREAGLATFGDLANAPFEQLVALLGRAGAIHVQTLARGEDERSIVAERRAKSIGAENTFEHDLTTREDLEVRLLELAGRVARRLVDVDLAASTVTVKVKYSDFSVKTRALRLPEPVADTDSIHGAAKLLLGRFTRGRVRLLGVAVSNFSAAGAQPPLIETGSPERRRRLEAVVANATDRFGERMLTRAALLEKAAKK